MAAFGAADYTVRLVDTTHPRAPVLIPDPLVGPVGEIYELAFHPQRDELAVSSSDGTIRLWDLNRLREPDLLATLDAASGGLLTVAFAPDGNTLVAGGSSSTVQLWNTDPNAVARWICRSTGDRATRSEWDQFVPDQPYAPPCP